MITYTCRYSSVHVNPNQSSHYGKYGWHDRQSVRPSYWYKSGCVALTLVMHRYGILPTTRLADIIVHISADTDYWSDVYIPHEFKKLFTSKTLVWSISDLHFMKTILSGSVKIICKFIADNRYWKMWPIKPISDYRPIIGASLLNMVYHYASFRFQVFECLATIPSKE